MKRKYHIKCDNPRKKEGPSINNFFKIEIRLLLHIPRSIKSVSPKQNVEKLNGEKTKKNPFCMMTGSAFIKWGGEFSRNRGLHFLIFPRLIKNVKFENNFHEKSL